MSGRSIVAAALLLAATGCRRGAAPPARAELASRAALAYADLAAAQYRETVTGAQALRAAIDAFVAAPTPNGLSASRAAWLAARTPYLETEAFRFYDGPIDRVEPLINGWPVDENYIDYVAGAPEAGIVNDAKTYPELSIALLVSLNEKEGEKNISTGYHAIEFLLWGQDDDARGPGRRTAADYLPPARSAKRRGQYLRLGAELLVRDLEQVAAAWAPGRADNYRARFLAQPPEEAVRLIVKGVGSLSGPELTGERLTVAYETKDQENEHSCFSDNTHNDVLGDLRGIEKVTRLLHPLLAADDEPLAGALDGAVAASLAAARRIPAPFDQALVGRDDAPGRRAIQATIAAVETQTATLARVAAKVGVRLSGASLAVAR